MANNRRNRSHESRQATAEWMAARAPKQTANNQDTTQLVFQWIEGKELMQEAEKALELLQLSDSSQDEFIGSNKPKYTTQATQKWMKGKLLMQEAEKALESIEETIQALPDEIQTEAGQILKATPDDKKLAWVEEALTIVRGARKNNYGHPLINFFRIANFWNVQLRGKLKEDEWITPADIALLFVQVKMAREMEIHKSDNPVDMFGYLLTYNAIHDAMKTLGYEDGIQAFEGMSESDAMKLCHRLEQDESLLSSL